jgi:hypothetical protein
MPHYGSCHVPCAGGHPCVCDNRPHQYHTCRHTTCICRRSYPPIPDPLPLPRKAALLGAAPMGGHLDLLKLLRHIRATSRRANAPAGGRGKGGYRLGMEAR